MLGRFGRDAGSVLGVEIASDSVRIVELQRRRGRHELTAWAVEPIQRGGVDTEVQAMALRQAWHRCGSRSRRVALAVPGSQVICKVGQLPAALAESEREARLLADAERLFPFPIDDLALDFQVLGTSQQAPDMLDVLVGAARQSFLEPLLQPFEAAGLEVVVVELDGLALRRLQAVEYCRPLLQVEADSLTLHGWPDGPMPWRKAQRIEPGVGTTEFLTRVESLLEGDRPFELTAGLMVGGGAATDACVRSLARHFGFPCEQVCPQGVHAGSLPDHCSALVLPLSLALGGAQ
ncbi:pilus assembly protein PilM [Pseudomonas sp. RW3S2]|uniref:type IV pilus biogenesis protein PilM n=1 Tax=Pseudomonas sp. RW3S2 TaxID=485884 RepID=UPI0016459D94|nr:pilus assembly protein PilM [Pseudomonas sp. RW3S2]MBC3422627.1 pilus assembly protein PilM [Pseudomonas sp. RW3S2]